MLNVESLSERNENQRLEIAKKRHQFIIRGTIAAVIVILILAAFLVYRMCSSNTFHSYKVIRSIKRSDSSSAVYQEYSGKLLKYSRDGALGYDTDLHKNWSGSYNFSSPLMDTCGEYVALADSGGKEIYVFDGKDSPVQINVLHPISLIQVASQGVVAVVMENDDSDMVQLYDSENSNKLLVEFSTNVDEDGYPVDISLSDDGSKLVTSYLSVANGVTTTKLTFYNLGEIGKNYSNKIVGSESFEQEIVSKVQFLGNDTVCAFGENGFTLYSMKQLVDTIKTVKIKTPLKSIFCTEENIGLVCKDSDKTNKNEVLLYDLKGKRIMSSSLDFAYTNVYMTDDQIFFLSSQECHIMRTNGTLKFSGTFSRQISYLMPVNSFNKYILVDKDRISLIRITEG